MSASTSPPTTTNLEEHAAILERLLAYRAGTLDEQEAEAVQGLIESDPAAALIWGDIGLFDDCSSAAERLEMLESLRAGNAPRERSGAPPSVPSGDPTEWIDDPADPGHHHAADQQPATGPVVVVAAIVTLVVCLLLI